MTGWNIHRVFCFDEGASQFSGKKEKENIQ